jgi:D-arabinose 5-phosphate isomerase GutQ
MDNTAEAGSRSSAHANAGTAHETMLFQDIRKQPEQLARSLSHMFGAGKPALEAAAAVLRGAGPIVISGIGASWHAGMAMQAQLLGCGCSALLMDASELLHFAQVPHGASVVLLSRSGKSTEIAQLIEKCRSRSATIISITNQIDSPLAQGSHIVLDTSTDFDHAVSVSTYSAIAMAGALLACEATGHLAQSLHDELLQALVAAAAAIPGWVTAVAPLTSWPAAPASQVAMRPGCFGKRHRKCRPPHSLQVASATARRRLSALVFVPASGSMRIACAVRISIWPAIWGD